ncbi:MAG: PASTA domain-containing protein, partial [Deltaproteobacteria bacterium]|nr:PASTA domain-containing protein [Deltaproteobacteria bacterium]
MNGQLREKNSIHCFLLTAIVAFLCLYMGSFAYADATAKEVWEVRVAKAEQLENRDWGVRRVSDPYVVVHKWPGNTIIGTTRVVKDSLNPVWDQSFTYVYDASFPPSLNFKIWDEDPLKKTFLGMARVIEAREGIYRLQLFRCYVGPRCPRLKSGFLTVSIRRLEAEKVHVPSLIGLTKTEAWKALRGKGFRASRQIVYTQTMTPDEGKIYAQNPTAGALVDKGASLMVLMHEAQRRVMPRVTSMSEKQARNKLQFLLKPPRIQYNHSLAQIRDPDKWYRVTKQGPRPGTRVTLDAPVTLIVAVPAPGTPVEMPDL